MAETNGPACACRRVECYTATHEGGTRVDRWLCVLCMREFFRRPMSAAKARRIKRLAIFALAWAYVVGGLVGLGIGWALWV